MDYVNRHPFPLALSWTWPAVESPAGKGIWERLGYFFTSLFSAWPWAGTGHIPLQKVTAPVTQLWGSYSLLPLMLDPLFAIPSKAGCPWPCLPFASSPLMFLSCLTGVLSFPARPWLMQLVPGSPMEAPNSATWNRFGICPWENFYTCFSKVG